MTVEGKQNILKTPAGDKSNIAKAPDGVSEQGVVEDLVTAQLQAVVALPSLLMEMIDAIDNLSAAVAPVGLYFKRKGIAESVLGPDDIASLEEDEEEEDKNE